MSNMSTWLTLWNEVLLVKNVMKTKQHFVNKIVNRKSLKVKYFKVMLY